MLERTKSGRIIIDGQGIDMYRLGDWLQRVHEAQTGNRVRFRDVDEALLKQAQQDDPGIFQGRR